MGMSKRGAPAVRTQMSYAGTREGRRGPQYQQSCEPENSSSIVGLFRTAYGAGGGGAQGIKRA